MNSGSHTSLHARRDGGASIRDRAVATFATLALHLRRLSSQRIIELEHIDPARIRKTLSFYVRSLPALLSAERCNIFVYDPNAAKAWVDVGTGVTEREFELPMNRTLIGEVIATAKPLIVNDLPVHGGVRIELERGTAFVGRNVAYAPIRSRHHDEVIGVIEVLNKKGGNGFARADLLVIEEAAEGIQDLVDSVFLAQKVYSAVDELIFLSRPAILVIAGVILLSWILTVLLLAAWSAMPAIDEAINPSLAPFIPKP